jgi:hypothetical protein
MAIQSRSAARARSDAVVGALVVATVAIVIAGFSTLLGSQGDTSSIFPPSAQERAAAAQAAAEQAAAQRALIDVRAGERSMYGTTSVDPMSAIRQGEKAPLLTKTEVGQALVDARAGEKVSLLTPTDVQNALIEVRAAEREGR